MVWISAIYGVQVD